MFAVCRADSFWYVANCSYAVYGWQRHCFGNMNTVCSWCWYLFTWLCSHGQLFKCKVNINLERLKLNISKQAETDAGMKWKTSMIKDYVLHKTYLFQLCKYKRHVIVVYNTYLYLADFNNGTLYRHNRYVFCSNWFLIRCNQKRSEFINVYFIVSSLFFIQLFFLIFMAVKKHIAYKKHNTVSWRNVPLKPPNTDQICWPGIFPPAHWDLQMEPCWLPSGQTQTKGDGAFAIRGSTLFRSLHTGLMYASIASLKYLFLKTFLVMKAFENVWVVLNDALFVSYCLILLIWLSSVFIHSLLHFSIIYLTDLSGFISVC